MTTIDLDTCLDLVADRGRRSVLYELRYETNGTTTIDDLVEQLYWSAPTTIDAPSPNREQLSMQLRHTSLPKLDDHGLVEYDTANGTVEYQPDPQLEALLDLLPDEDVVLNP